MKSNLRIVLLLLIPTLLLSQTPVSKIIYFDSLWKETTESNHKYYRIIKDYYSDKESYVVSDYYKSGALQMVGTSKNKDYLSQEGQFVYYYENGNKKTVSNYTKSRPNGKQYNWYENGNPKSEIEYIEDQKGITSDSKINQFWNAEKTQKVINGNGDYEDLSESYHESGKIKNGLHDGIWKGSSKNPNYSYTENYENGKLVSGVSIDSAKVEHKYEIAEVRPVPKKGMDHFYRYISRTMRIPEAARNTVFGKIYLTFVIEKDGSIVDIKIIRGLGHGLDEEVTRVIKNYKEWLPGLRRGIPLRVLYSIPITIVK